MAVGRCEKCGLPTQTKHNYTHAHKLLSSPVGHNLLCGNSGCARPISIIWLSDKEKQQYLGGQRFFKVTRMGEVQVT
jgi:hypothetical protein